MKTRLLALAMTVVLVAVTLPGCGAGGGSNQPAVAVSVDDFQPVVLRLSHTRTESSTNHEVLTWFAEEVYERTGGDITIEIYPNSALGDYETVQERTSMGDIDMFMHGPGVAIDKSLMLAVLPYLISDWDQAREYMDIDDGIVADFVKRHFAELDLTTLGSHPLYFACFVSAVPLENYTDPTAQHGIKARVPANRSFELMAESFGYIATPLSATELYSALQTGIVDAVFGGGAEAWYDNIRDLVKYIVPMRTHFETHWLCINTDTFNSLPVEYQEILYDLGRQVQEKGFENAIANEDKYYQLFEELGAVVLDISDEEIEAFANRYREFAWPELESTLSDDAVELLDIIRQDYGLNS